MVEALPVVDGSLQFVTVCRVWVRLGVTEDDGRGPSAGYSDRAVRNNAIFASTAVQTSDGDGVMGFLECEYVSSFSFRGHFRAGRSVR